VARQQQLFPDDFNASVYFIGPPTLIPAECPNSLLTMFHYMGGRPGRSYSVVMMHKALSSEKNVPRGQSAHANGNSSDKSTVTVDGEKLTEKHAKSEMPIVIPPVREARRGDMTVRSRRRSVRSVIKVSVE